jgi:hypothetical protein
MFTFVAESQTSVLVINKYKIDEVKRFEILHWSRILPLIVVGSSGGGD